MTCGYGRFPGPWFPMTCGSVLWRTVSDARCNAGTRSRGCSRDGGWDCPWRGVSRSVRLVWSCCVIFFWIGSRSRAESKRPTWASGRSSLSGAFGFETPWSRTSGLSPDRKSTRLNSSHLVISYAVFCLKKIILPTRNVSFCNPRDTRAHAHRFEPLVNAAQILDRDLVHRKPALFFFLMIRQPPNPTLFPYRALFQ